MQFLEHFAKYLLTVEALSELLEARIYPAMIPAEEPAPYGVFKQISNAADLNHSGAQDSGEIRIQFDFYAESFSAAADLAAALRQAFEGKRIEIASGVSICFCRFETDFDAYLSEEQLFRRSLDLLIQYTIITQ